jgi:hypothetical protein
MASLTPLSKGLIALAVVGGMASAVWHLGLKDRIARSTTEQIQPANSPPVPAPDTAPSTIAAPSVPVAPPSAPTVAPRSGGANKLSPADNAEMGRKLMAGGEYSQARAYLEAAVQGGDGGAACHLGEMALKGQGGLTANQDQAAKLFQLAQSRGSICFASGQ